MDRQLVFLLLACLQVISTGSLTVDRNRNAVWVSMPAFQDKSTEIKVVVKGISLLSLNQALDW
jgi:hypothetical protein